MSTHFKNMSSLNLVLVGTLALASFGAAAQTPPNSMAATHPFGASAVIKDRYLVVFKSHVTNPGQEASNAMRGVANGQIHHTYSQALKGFAATIPPAALNGLRNNPNIESIEPDLTVKLNQISPQNQATWGLDRIDQADRPLDTQYHFGPTGAGVNAFIIDTGIRADHAEFTGRVLAGFTAINDGQGTADCNGHGTHVSGTVGGSTWGVAKQVKLVPVRVLDCAGSGSYSGVIAGIDWVAGSGLRPAVANMSLGGSYSSTLNAAVAGAVAKGVTMVIAAGNSNVDACTTSPAGEPSAITVGATTSADQRASYSNFGACVDVFAPGTSITSAWNTGTTATNTISGTSMASPHVAGVVALALQGNPEALPAAVASYIVSTSTTNRLTSTGTGSPNRLLYALGSASTPAPAVQTVAIKAMSATAIATKGGKEWTATVVVSVRDVNSSAAVANAKVTGNFTPGVAASCVTASTGSCTLPSPTFTKSVTRTDFAVSNVSGTNLSYAASQNTVTQVTILKP